MIRPRSLAVAILCFVAAAGVANASWYDDYEAGVKAARAGNWSVVVDKMTKAIAGNAKEDNKARTYGAIFINYHPYYYRGVAYTNLGKYDQAIADLEKTSGAGPYDMGSIEQLVKNAKAANEEPVAVATTSTRAPVTTPSTPVIDANLRAQAQAQVNDAKSKIDAARARRASGPTLDRALSQFADASGRLSSADSNEDLRAAITAATSAGLLAESATAPVAIATATTSTPPATSTTIRVTPPSTTRVAGAASAALASPSQRLREALVKYFDGDFDDASAAFQQLTRDMPRNGWIWAFLGASQYSQYAFEAEPSYKDAAIESFKKAKALGFGKNGLPPRYFSKRIQRAFKENAG